MGGLTVFQYIHSVFDDAGIIAEKTYPAAAVAVEFNSQTGNEKFAVNEKTAVVFEFGDFPYCISTVFVL